MFMKGTLTEGVRLGTIGLLVLNSSDQLLFTPNFFYNTSYLDKEVTVFSSPLQ
jgi:hypothetical protein